MRHGVFGNQLHRNTNKAKALYRGLVAELFEHGRIETTIQKAKAVQGMVDKLITVAKKNSVNARRIVVKTLGGDASLDRLFKEIAPKLSNRNSGYTRIIRLGARLSDTAEKVYLEIVEGVEIAPAPIKEEKPKPEAKAKKAKKKTI